MKITVVSPHRDDAAFSLGLSIEHWLSAGHRVHVLNCFTQSDYAPYSDADALHPNDRVSFVSAVRKREDAAWNKLEGGKIQFTDLDLLDAPIRLVCSVGEAFTASIRPGDRALARVAGAIAKLARGAPTSDVAIALPLALGGHIDHRVTLQAALQALAGKELPIAFYEDLPYAAQPGAAEEAEQLGRATGLNLQPGFDVPKAADITMQMKRKRRIAESYDSQVDSDAVQQIAQFCETYQGRERLWGNELWRTLALAGIESPPSSD